MKNPYFPFYVRDWMCSRSVLSMSGDAVKAYIYLLAESWLQVPRATLPKDDKELASMARCSIEKWQSIKNEVLHHYKSGVCNEHFDRIYQETLLEISRKSESKQRLNNKNAKRSQIKRKVNAAPENEIDIKSGISKNSLHANAKDILNNKFEEWFKIYPRKVSKKKAKEIFIKINPSDELYNKMINVLSKQKTCEQWKITKYVPHPSTYLNQERWNDEVFDSPESRAKEAINNYLKSKESI